VGPAGEQVGIVRIEDALRLAQEADLDLVEVAPMERPPVCKLMDYGKFKYEAAQKDREARRNQAHTVIKEMKLRPKIDPHDYETKKGHVVRFLKAGDKVKVTIMFRGREQSRPEVGYKLLQRLAGDVEELGYIETSAKQDGRNMTMVMAPHRVVKELAAKSRPVKKIKGDEGYEPGGADDLHDDVSIDDLSIETELSGDLAEVLVADTADTVTVETPAEAAPVEPAPVAAAPVAAAPVTATPAAATPVAATPAAATPARPTPARPGPARPTPPRPTPARTTPAAQAPAPTDSLTTAELTAPAE
jgi:translation initiation factor IF-3